MNSWRNVVFGRCIPSLLATIGPDDCQPNSSGSLDVIVQLKDIAGNVSPLPDGLFLTVSDSKETMQTLPLAANDDGIAHLTLTDMTGVEAVAVLTDKDGYQMMNGDRFMIRYVVDEEVQEEDYAHIYFRNDHHELRIECMKQDPTELELYTVKRNEFNEIVPLEDDDCYAVHITQSKRDHVVTLDRSNDHHVTLQDVFSGMVCIHMEDAEGYALSYRFNNGPETDCGEMDILAGTHNEAQLILTKKPSNILTLTKLIREDDGTLVVPQNGCFSVHVLGASMDQIVMLNEANHFTADLFDMCPGMYSISEECTGGYEVSYIVNGMSECNYAQVEMDACDSNDVMIINSYPVSDDCCGSRLRICKYIRDDHGRLNRPCGCESFKVMLTGCGRQEVFNLNESNNWCVDIDTICSGYYEVCELDCNEYSTSYIVNGGEEMTTACVNVSEGFSNSVKVVNTERCKGRVTISKYIRNENGELVRPKRDYVFYATLKSYFMKESFVLNEANDWCVSFDNLREGSYEVKEQCLDDMDTWYMVNGCPMNRKARFIVEGSGTNEVKIVNEERPSHIGTLTICKMMETEGGALVKPSGSDRFEIRLEGGGECVDTTLSYRNGWRICADDLRQGTYCVSELNSENVRYLVDGCERSCACVEMDECPHEIVIINPEDRFGTLRICSRIETCDGDLNRPDDRECFTVLVEGRKFSKEYVLSCENNWCISMDQLPKGRYRIYQKDDYGYLVSYEINGKRKNRASVSLYEQDIEVTIINQVRTCVGEVCISKWICDDGELCTPEYGCYEIELKGRRYKECFTLDAENSFTVCLNDLEEGKYHVKEIKGNGRILINGCDSDGSFIVGRSDIDIRVVNDTIPVPLVTIEKQLKDECGNLCKPEEDDCFEILVEGKNCRDYYTLDCTNDWKICLDQLEAGMYHIYEKACGYEVSFMIDGECRNDGSFSVAKKDVHILMINEMLPHADVEVSKWIRDESGMLVRPHRDECFEIKIEGESYCQTFDLNYDNNWCLCLDDLRPGRYEIKEAMCPEYDASFIIDDKEMTQGIFFVDMNDVEIKVINQDRVTGNLDICAFVREGGSLYDPIDSDAFTFCIAKDGCNEEYTLDCSNDWCIRLENLYSGIYRISTADSDYQMEVEVDGCPVMEGRVPVDCGDTAVKLIFAKIGCDVHVCKCMMEEECLIKPTNDQHFTMKLSGEGREETLHLTHRNNFEMTVHDVKNGRYEIVEINHEGFETMYEINGCEQMDGRFEVMDEDVDITVINEEMQNSGILSIHAMIRDCNNNLLSPSGNMRFHVDVESREFSNHYVLSSANQWRVEIAGLKQARYSIVQELEEGMEKVRYRINGGRELNHAMVSISEQDQSVEIINVMDCNKGSISICKLYRDNSCGCLSKPIGDEAYKIVLSGPAEDREYVLNAENEYCVKAEMLDDGMYLIKEVPIVGNQVTYMVDGGKETKEAVVHVLGSAHQVKVINSSASGDSAIQICKFIRSDGSLSRPSRGTYQVVLRSGNFSQEFTLNQANRYCVKVDQLQDGVYEVEELGGRDVTYIVDGKAETQTARVSVNGGSHSISVINREGESDAGSIRICKYLRNAGGELVKPASSAVFEAVLEGPGMAKTMILSAANNWCAAADDLQAGTYRIMEKNSGDNTVSYMVNDEAESDEAYIEVDGSANEVKIINTPSVQDRGSITLRKYVRSADNQMMQPDSSARYRIHVSKSGFNRTITLDKNNNFTMILSNLTDGNYTVEELGDHQVTYIIDGGNEVNFAVVTVLGSAHQVDIINQEETKDNGTIQICKYIRDTAGDLIRPSGNREFEVQISKAGYNETKKLNRMNNWCVTLENLKPGNYTVQEMNNGDDVTYIVNDGSEIDYAVVYVNGEANTVQIINRSEASQGGSLHLCKFIRNTQGQLIRPNGDAKYLMHVSGPGLNLTRTLDRDNDWCDTLNNLPTGTYVLQELSTADKVTYIINNGSEVDNAIVRIDQTASHVQVINTALSPSGGSIQLCKYIRDERGLLVRPSGDAEFLMHISGPGLNTGTKLNRDNNWCTVYDRLGEGTYVLQEITTGDKVTYIVNGGSEVDNGIIDVRGNTNIVQVVNSQMTPPQGGTIQICKYLRSSDNQLVKPSGAASYQVRITAAGYNEIQRLDNTNNWCVKLENLSNGNYTISEVDNPNKVSYIINDGSEVDYATVFVNHDVNEVKMINYPGVSTGSITLRKRIKSADGSESAPVLGDEFSVALMSANFYQIYTLNYDNRFIETISDLPKGTYTVQEADNSGEYQVTYRINNQAPVEIGQLNVDNNANHVDIINELTADANSLEFMKFVVQENGTLGKPRNDEVFQVIVQGPSVNETVELNQENNWYHYMNNLPEGNYTLRESQAAGYTTSYIVNGGEPLAEAAFFVGPDVSNLVEILNTADDQAVRGSITAQVMVEDADGILHKPQPKQEFHVRFSGEDIDQVVALNQNNRFMYINEQLDTGTYYVEAQDSYGYEPYYRINGGEKQPYARVNVVDSRNHNVTCVMKQVRPLYESDQKNDHSISIVIE